MNIKPFNLERYFAEYEFNAKYLLCSSDCEPLSLKELLEAADKEAISLWANLKMAYTESSGLPELRAEIASMYEGINSEQVIVLGPEEGIYISMQTLLDEGDEVITTFPGYQSLYELANSKGCITKRWEPDNNVFDVNNLEKLISDKTRMLVINFPHNPTGALLKKDELDKIIEIVRERDILLFSDEMYRFLEFRDEDRLPSACEIYKNSISLCGMSKSFSLPGLRIGWLIIHDPEIMLKIKSYKDYTTICNAGPSEILALIGLRNRQSIIDRNLNIIKKNIILMEEFSKRNSNFMRWISPDAGSIAFPEIFVEGETDTYCRKLVEDTGVMLLPSTVYGYKEKRIRIGLGRADFEEGLGIWEGLV